jgi:hypothetical protein
MPTEVEWRKIHADLMAKLKLPCQLEFSTQIRVGGHGWEDTDADFPSEKIPCCITINPNADFRVPEHLIMHEAAHHRMSLIDPYHSHDKRWAKILVRMYKEAGVPLPQSTMFEEFARVAKIELKKWNGNGSPGADGVKE